MTVLRVSGMLFIPRFGSSTCMGGSVVQDARKICNGLAFEDHLLRQHVKPRVRVDFAPGRHGVKTTQRPVTHVDKYRWPSCLGSSETHCRRCVGRAARQWRQNFEAQVGSRPRSLRSFVLPLCCDRNFLLRREFVDFAELNCAVKDQSDCSRRHSLLSYFNSDTELWKRRARNTVANQRQLVRRSIP